MNYDQGDEISQLSDRNQETGSALPYNILRKVRILYVRRDDSPNEKQEGAFCPNKEERRKHTLKYTNKKYLSLFCAEGLSVLN